MVSACSGRERTREVESRTEEDQTDRSSPYTDPGDRDGPTDPTSDI